MSSGSFGFEIPTGDPGALRCAARAWKELGAALDGQAQAVTAGCETALNTGGWTGRAAGSFTEQAQRVIAAARSGVEACATASGALSELADALEHAQQVTRQAQTACEQAQTELTTQQQAADQAGQDAANASRAAAAAPHPAAASELQRQADASLRAQRAAQDAAGRAQNDLTTQQSRGRQAVTDYDHTAVAVIGRLQAAAGELKPLTEVDANWADPIIEWAGHVNDFAGAGSVAVKKSLDKILERADNVMINQVDEYRVQGKFTPEGEELFDEAATHWKWANSRVVTVLTKGLPEDKFGVLGKVPYLGWAFTGADIALNRADGDSWGSAVREPVGNLVLGTGIAEGASSGIAALAASDGVVGSLVAVPGVGEVVIVGGVTVGVVMGVDYLWDHGGEHLAEEAWHGTVSTVKHVVHDLEPWHW